jgi:adenylate cyclase
MAEVELAGIDDEVLLPPWAGEEVTDDPRFRNSAIALIAMPLIVA